MDFAVGHVNVPRLAERAEALELECLRPIRGHGLAPKLARLGVRLEAKQEPEQQQRRSGGPRLRPGGRRVGDRERRLAAPEAGEHLRERPVEEPRRGEQRVRDPVHFPGTTGARQPPGPERRVVRPDGAVVVAERVVRGILRRHRPDPPPRPEVVLHQPARDRLHPLRRNDPAPEQVADVRADRVDGLLVAVERERVEATALLDPVRRVEALLELRRIRLEPVGELLVAPGRSSDLGEADAWRRRHNPAPRPARSVPGRSARRGTAASLPSPSRTGSRARAASAARTRRSRRRRGRRNWSIHSSAASAGPRSRSANLGVAGPAPDLGEQDEEERGRVDRAVVARRTRSRRPGPGGARAGSCRARRRSWDRPGCLQRGERVERADRELGPEEQRLQRGDDRVAAEDGHEPGHARGGQHREPVVAAHPQRGQVRDRLPESEPHVLATRLQARHPQAPRGQRLVHVLALGAEAALDDVRLGLLAVDRVHDVDPQVPTLAGRKTQLVADARLGRGAHAREQHLGLGAAAAVLFEHELIRRRVVTHRHRVRQRPRRERVAEREVVLLDGDDVREVGADLQRELELELLLPLVAEDEMILHARADEARPRDRERVLRQPRHGRVAHVERGGEVLDLPRREQQGASAADAQLEAGEYARVLGEETARLAVEVADLVADAEGRSLEDRQAHAVSSARCVRRSTAPGP